MVSISDYCNLGWPCNDCVRKGCNYYEYETGNSYCVANGTLTGEFDRIVESPDYEDCEPTPVPSILHGDWNGITVLFICLFVVAILIIIIGVAFKVIKMRRQRPRNVMGIQSGPYSGTTCESISLTGLLTHADEETSL